MKIIIELEDTTKEYDEMYKKISEPTHKSLAGNQDYEDCNIVLNIDSINNIPTNYLYFSGNDCKDKEFIREKAKELIDRFVNSL